MTSPLNTENEDPQLTASNMQEAKPPTTTPTSPVKKEAKAEIMECPSDECPSDEDPYEGSSVNREVVQVLKHKIALTEMEASMVPQMDQMLGTYDKVVTALVAENDDLRRRVVDENEEEDKEGRDEGPPPETEIPEKDTHKTETRQSPPPPSRPAVPSLKQRTILAAPDPILKQRVTSCPDPIQQFRAYVAMSPDTEKQKGKSGSPPASAAPSTMLPPFAATLPTPTPTTPEKKEKSAATLAPTTLEKEEKSASTLPAPSPATELEKEEPSAPTLLAPTPETTVEKEEPKENLEDAPLSAPPQERNEEDEEAEHRRSPVIISVIESHDEVEEGEEYPGVEMVNGEEKDEATVQEEKTEEPKPEEGEEPKPAKVEDQKAMEKPEEIFITKTREAPEDLRSTVDADSQSVDDITNLLLKKVEDERANADKETERNLELTQEVKKLKYELDAARCDAVLRRQERVTEDAKYAAVEADMKIKTSRLEKLLEDREEEVASLSKEVDEYKDKFTRAKQMLLANADLMDTAREIIAKGAQQPQLPPSTTATSETTSRSVGATNALPMDADAKDRRIAELEEQIKAMQDKEQLQSAMIYNTLEDARNFVMEASRASCEAIVASASAGAKSVNYIQQKVTSTATGCENPNGSTIGALVPYMGGDNKNPSTPTEAASTPNKRQLVIREVDPKELEDENRDQGQEVAVYEKGRVMDLDTDVVVVVPPSLRQEEEREEAEQNNPNNTVPGLFQV